MDIRIKRGHDLRLVGVPEQEVVTLQPVNRMKLHPVEFPGIKPKLLVKQGERVQKGSPVYLDKNRPEIMFTSPVNGEIDHIVYGERRKILAIDISVKGDGDEVIHKSHSMDEINNLTRDVIVEQLCKSGLWPAIRRRPFSKIAEPGNPPKSIFITAMPTAPFAPDYEFIIEQDAKGLTEGIAALSKLTDGNINLVVHQNCKSQKLLELQNVSLHRFSGPHPAGNVGVHIAHIDPIKDKNDIVWYISLQDVMRIGRFYLTGKVDESKVITVAGSAVAERKYFKVKRGTIIADILQDNKVEENSRFISGDVLAGIQSDGDNALGFYDETLTVIPEGRQRHFIGWISPGFNKYTLSRAFLSKLLPQKPTNLTTSKNGSERAIIPLGNLEKVLPLNLLPTMLVKSIIARDIDTMEQLGIYECAPEDFALCSFTDASKMEISGIIQEGLDFVEAQG